MPGNELTMEPALADATTTSASVERKQALKPLDGHFAPGGPGN